jgi:lipid-binding SYLF domain-containing protein
MKITLRSIALILLTISFISSTNINASKVDEIDAAIDSALERFSNEIQGGATYLAGARGVLVIPKMIKAGVILGMEFGEGALIVDEIKIQYYRAFTTSLGIQVGVGRKDMVILFFDDAAMDEFLYSSGWEVGVDGSVALFNIGAGGSADTITSKDPIVGFVFGHKGLMAGMSLEGTKFSKSWPDSDINKDQEQLEIDEFNEENIE